MQSFDIVVFVNKLTSQPEARHSALPIAVANDGAGAVEYFDGKFAAVFGRHTALNTNEDRRGQRAIIVERFRAIDHFDATALAGVYVGRRFIRVGKPSPAADVVDEYGLETHEWLRHVAQQCL